MQKVINQNNMTNKQAFIYATERAGINIQYYLDTKNIEFINQAILYVRGAYALSKEMNDELD